MIEVEVEAPNQIEARKLAIMTNLEFVEKGLGKEPDRKMLAIAFSIPKEPKKMTSTEYSKKSLDRFKEAISEGEGLSDLEEVQREGISPDVKANYYAWKAFEDWINKDRYGRRTVRNLIDWIQSNIYPKPDIDKTTLNHSVNKFMFLGLLSRKKRKDGEYEYRFNNVVIGRGLFWFRLNNEYMTGLFQSQRGFFNLFEKEE